MPLRESDAIFDLIEIDTETGKERHLAFGKYPKMANDRGWREKNLDKKFHYRITPRTADEVSEE